MPRDPLWPANRTRYGGRERRPINPRMRLLYCVCGHHRDVHTYESGICLAMTCRCEHLRLPRREPGDE